METISIRHDTGPGFVDGLLADQRSMTAVEQFSVAHDQQSHALRESSLYRELMSIGEPSADEQFAFEVNLDRCSGCKACVAACHTMNGLDEDEAWRSVGTLSAVTANQGSLDAMFDLPVVQPTRRPAPLARQTLDSVPAFEGIQHVTAACHHCADPGCMKGCPVKAYEKDALTGIVRHLDDQCIGCKYCTMMCPYDVPQYNERLGIVRKCDMCYQRLSVGEPPACVQACPSSAIKIIAVPRGSLARRSSAAVTYPEELLPGAPRSSITQPTTRYCSERFGSLHGLFSQDRQIDRPADGHWPLVGMLVCTQATWGIVAIDAMLGLVSIGGASSSLDAPLTTLAAFLFAAVGMAVAPLHLGQPLRAWRIFLGIRTSWLSREAILLGTYVTALALLTVLACFPAIGAFAFGTLPVALDAVVLERFLAATVVVVGCLAVMSSAMVYVATERELWNAARTFTRFFGCAVTLGLAGVLPSLVAGGDEMAVAVALGMSMLLALRLSSEPGIVRRSHHAEGTLIARAERLVRGPLRRVRGSRIVAAAVGAALCLIAACKPEGMASVNIAIVGGAALITGEVAERILYFKSVVFHRMPGTL